MTPGIIIRALEPAAWQAFRDFRLAALRQAPGVFSTRHEVAAARSREAWQANIQGPSNQAFGLFDGDRLIGIAAVFANADDATGATAGLAMSYILPAWRGRGLSRVLYEARLDWVRARPQFRRVIVAHRASNDAARRMIAAFGFRETHRTVRTWPDGAREDEIAYELAI